MSTTSDAPGARQRIVRAYRTEDAAATVDVFDLAIRCTAAAYYVQSQLDAWNPGVTDLEKWDRARSTAWTVVSDTGTGIAGFADLTRDGLLDMLYVHPAHAGIGVGRSLIECVLGEARRRGQPQVRTFASRAAKPVFERFGFVVDRHNYDNTVRGLVVPNFTMHLPLD